MKSARAMMDYSYRSDPDVPAFEDAGPVVFMDGECILCTFGARLIARYDRQARFRICPVQSGTGTAVMRHFGLDPASPDTWMLLVGGRAHTCMDAMILAGRMIGGPGWLLQPFRLLPRPVRDWLYRRIARNRYLLGRTEMCAVPDAEFRARLIE